MDVPREGAARKRWIRRIIYIVVGAGVLAGISWKVSRMKPAAQAVDRGVVWIDTVKRGQMLREVRGLGTLVPEEVLYLPATTDGRIENIVLRPGAIVKPDSVIMQLTNPQLENDALDALYQLKAAEANLIQLKVTLESSRLSQVAATASVESDYMQAKITAERDEELTKLGLNAEIVSKLSRAKADELNSRHSIEQKRLDISGESNQAQLDAQKVQIEKLKALYELKKRQVAELKVLAGTTGTLLQLGTGTVPVDVGQRVTAGTILAKVAQPWKLKAELRIAETQAKDVMIGQVASVDTRNGVIPGKVSRVDPAPANGTVAVDVKLEGTLPQGARPDLSVDGTITIEKLTDVIFVGRPVFGEANHLVTLFKLDADGREANKAQVKLGRMSVNTVEIVEGLRVGDQVILSDMSQWDANNTIRLQ